MDFIIFSMLVALGAFVQTITGFAMGLIVMGGVALLGIIELTAAAAVVSLTSLANVLVALRRHYRHIHRRLVASIVTGMLPMIFLGVLLLEYLSNQNLLILKTLLGVVIVVAGLLLVRKPDPFQDVSKPYQAGLAGMAAGLMGGLYGAGGAPIAYLMYRQPLTTEVIRTSLLSTFAISTLIRTGFVANEGHLTQEVFILVAVSIPVVVVVTLFGDRIAPMLPEALVQKVAFWLLILIGSTLAAGGAWELLV